MAEKEPGPDTPSGDYAAMSSYWTMVQTMLDGTEAMRKAGEKYLPRFPKESKKNYEHRRKSAKFTNIFRDIVENLAAKPFAKELTVKEDSISPELKEFIDDVDGSGNHIHVFSGVTFFHGVAKAIDYIFVDYTKVPEGASLAAEKAIGARPYWVRLDAQRVLAAYTATVKGKEEFIHVRISEPTMVREGFSETLKDRVRVYDRAEVKTVDTDTGAQIATYEPATWTLYEKRINPNTKKEEWVQIDNGSVRIGIIPLVPIITGRRIDGSWQFHPMLKDAADLQIEHYQQETNLKSAKDETCFPMLKALGIAVPEGKTLERGAHVVLVAPPDGQGNHGDFQMLEPSAESLKFLAAEIEKTELQLRELGRQPLTAQSGNLTVVTTAVAAAKGNSAVQAWALNLKDALELALEYTAMWLNDTTSKPEVQIYTDFGIELGDGTSMDRLLQARANGDLDQENLWEEFVRRGELRADFDPKEAKKRLADEAPDPDEEDDVIASMVGRTPPGGRPPPNGPPNKIREAA